MQTNENLNDLRLVTLIAETGTLSGAAERLGINHATVFRRLGQLEQRLGVRLFERSGGRYLRTPAGEALADAGRQMQETANQALLKVAGQDLRPSGQVRLSTTDSLAMALLPPVMLTCRQQHPQIQLSVEVDNRAVNLSKRDADIAIRPTLQPPDYLIGKRISSVHFAVYGSASYLQAAGKRMLAEHQWIALDESFAGHRTLRWLNAILPVEQIGYRTSSFGCIRQACIDGLGLALLPCFLGDSSPSLQRVGELVPECAVELWILTHPDLRDNMRIKVVFQYLHTALQQAMQRYQN